MQRHSLELERLCTNRVSFAFKSFIECNCALQTDHSIESTCASTLTCCATPLGAVRALERPSWLTALPLSTASTHCPGSLLLV